METSPAWDDKRLPIVIGGPTATGKTDAAIALAGQIDGEIVNADSMQVYTGMDIGTAKPGQADRKRAAFHLLDVTRPDQPFTVSEWKRRAEAVIADIYHRGRQPIICGGTGLYMRALLNDWSLAATPADPALRKQLQAKADVQGAMALHAQLLTVDPITAARLHPNDAVRVIRALEVYHVTGTPISAYQEQDRQSRRPRRAHRFGLTLPRPLLYERINRRVEAMLAAGLETEVKALLAQGFSPSLGAMCSLGYKEMTAYLTGRQDYESAVADIKQNTRRFAKRQETWFRADPLIHWINVQSLDAAQVASAIRAAI